MSASSPVWAAAPYNCKPPPLHERLFQKTAPEKKEEGELKRCLNLFDLFAQGEHKYIFENTIVVIIIYSHFLIQKAFDTCVLMFRYQSCLLVMHSMHIFFINSLVVTSLIMICTSNPSELDERQCRLPWSIGPITFEIFSSIS